VDGCQASVGAARREEIDLLTPSCHNDLADAFVTDAYNNLSKKRVKGRPAVLVADDLCPLWVKS
jgi:hypothetical protein